MGGWGTRGPEALWVLGAWGVPGSLLLPWAQGVGGKARPLWGALGRRVQSQGQVSEGSQGEDTTPIPSGGQFPALMPQRIKMGGGEGEEDRQVLGSEKQALRLGFSVFFCPVVT